MTSDLRLAAFAIVLTLAGCDGSAVLSAEQRKAMQHCDERGLSTRLHYMAKPDKVYRITCEPEEAYLEGAEHDQ